MGAVHQQVRNGATVGGLLRQPERHRLGLGDARLNDLGDREVESPTRQMSFKLPLAVVVVDRNNTVAKAIIETNGSLGAVVGPPL